jgi:uncharacterized protein with HEPN domain
MKKDPLIFIGHVLECIDLIEKYTEGRTEGQFLEDYQLQDSVIRRIEIIGEAVKNIPDEIKSKYTDIEWKKIAGMRDVVVHDYLGIDMEMTWKVVIDDIPQLKKKILKLKEDLS